MQVSDIILGLLIILVLGWTMMIAVEQKGMTVSINALNLKQSAQAVLISPEKCNPVAGHKLVKANELAGKEYYTTAGFDHDTNRAFFCFYEAAP
jgi:hypothetical protein